MVDAIPEGYHAVTPSLIADGAAKLIDFMRDAFGATERLRIPMPDGRVAHAEVTIGGSPVMVADAQPGYPAMPGFIHLYVNDVDNVYKKALAAGAASHMAPEDRFYGDRAAEVRDSFGNRWSLATHVRDVSEEEMQAAMKAMSEA